MEKYIYVTEKESRKFRIIKIDDIKIIEPFKGGNGSAITLCDGERIHLMETARKVKKRIETEGVSI